MELHQALKMVQTGQGDKGHVGDLFATFCDPCIVRIRVARIEKTGHGHRPFLALGVPCTLTLAAGVQKPGTSTLL